MTKPDEPSGFPAYRISNIAFQCWIVDRSDLPGTSKYEWRDETNRLRAGKTLGRGGECWASVDGKPVKGYWPTLGSAMIAAVSAANRRQAA